MGFLIGFAMVMMAINHATQGIGGAIGKSLAEAKLAEKDKEIQGLKDYIARMRH
jgi:hypothetical protein